jgi:hypothetical protein
LLVQIIIAFPLHPLLRLVLLNVNFGSSVGSFSEMNTCVKVKGLLLKLLYNSELAKGQIFSLKSLDSFFCSLK